MVVRADRDRCGARMLAHIQSRQWHHVVCECAIYEGAHVSVSGLEDYPRKNTAERRTNFHLRHWLHWHYTSVDGGTVRSHLVHANSPNTRSPAHS
jgi:hypothetical protein